MPVEVDAALLGRDEPSGPGVSARCNQLPIWHGRYGCRGMNQLIFGPALTEMSASGSSVFGPVVFRDYVAEHGLGTRRTPEHISVNNWGALPAELKAANAMVFRLGRGVDPRTRFALVRAPSAADFFLFGAGTDDPASTFLSPASLRDLFGFSLVAPSETMLVSLACASGVLATALGFDEPSTVTSPSRGTMRASFAFRPHSGLDAVLEHVNGQVEVDALVLGRCSGKDVLFVLEAKQSPDPLAKHKLVYPVLALAERIPPDLEIVPVLLIARALADGIRFDVVRCAMPDPRVHALVAVDELIVASTVSLRLPLVGPSG